MSTAASLLLVLLLLAGALLLGRRWGEARENTRSTSAASGFFAAGYRAGHVQGWADSRAAETPGAPPPVSAPTPVPPREQPPVVRPVPAVQAVVPPFPQSRPVSAGQRPPLPVSRRPLVPPPLPAKESAADRAARKEKRDRQNINITLYVASLLLVAAGALFIGAALPAGLRFAGVGVITALFYAAGLILHAQAPRLRPAAVAFAGTGLALIPLAGLAMFNLTLHNGPAAWLISSVVGTVAYVSAAVRMDSKVLAYLSLTFVVSTGWSGISVLGGALVWYFVVLIAVAVLLTLLALTRPGWVPSVYLEPLMDLHPFVVPAVAAAGTFLPGLLSSGEYAFVMSLSGAYFALIAALPQSRFRVAHYYGARASLTVAAAAAAWAATGGVQWMILTVVVLAAFQAVLVASGRDVVAPALLGPAGRRRADALGTFGLQLLLTVVWGAAAWFDSAAGAPAGAGVPLWVPPLLALLTGMVLAVRLSGVAEWGPPAALVVTAAGMDTAGGWAPAGFLISAAVFWTVRSLPAAEPLRLHFVLAARVAVSLAFPAVAAAVTSASPAALPVVSAFLLGLLAQQLTTAVLVRTGVAAPGPNITLAAFTLAAVPTLAAVALADPTQGRAYTGAAIVLQLLVGLGIGLALSGAAASSPWRPGVPELLPVGMAAVLSGMAFTGVSFMAGNISLALTFLYLITTALRRGSLRQRWCYWWLARGVGTLLVLTGYHQLRRATGPVLVGGEELASAAVAVLVLGLQLTFPLLAAARGRAPRGVFADAAVVLVLQGAGLALLRSARPHDAGSWQLTGVVVLIALSAAAAGFVLRTRPAAAVFAPAALAGLLLARTGSALDVELVLGVFSVFSAVMVVAAAQRTAKGSYFAAARVLTLALALVLSYDAAASVTAVSVVFGLALAAQHGIRWFMRSRLQAVPFQQAAVWITLAGQAVLPAGLLAAAPDDGGRWAVLLLVVLLLVSAAVASRVFLARGAAYLMVYAAVFGTVALGPGLQFAAAASAGGVLDRPVLDYDGVVEVLLVLAAAAAGAGALLQRRRRDDVERWLWLVAAGGFAGAGLLLAQGASGWLVAAAVLVCAAVLFTASHVERWSVCYPPAVAAVLVGATLAAAELTGQASGVWSSYLPWLAGCAPAGVGLYAVRWLRRGPLAADPLRRWALASGGFLGLALTAAAGLRWDATAWTGAVLVAVAAMVCCIEAPVGGRRAAAELGALATTAAVQRAVLFAGPDASPGWPGWFWVLQWYVVLAAVLGALRLAAGNRPVARAEWAAGAGLLSLSGLGIIFGGDPSQQLWVLAVLAVLLVAGLTAGERLFVWWGAAGVALCILWALRQYTFALLALVAVALIGIAVWRLNRSKPAVAEPAPQPEPADHG
ncbi:hypothetical protein ACFDR8_000124 [Arthrobacter sp. MP_2.3]